MTGVELPTVAPPAPAVREGLEAWRGEGCCVSSPLDGVGFADGDRKDGSCHG